MQNGQLSNDAVHRSFFCYIRAACPSNHTNFILLEQSRCSKFKRTDVVNQMCVDCPLVIAVAGHAPQFGTDSTM